MITSKLFNDTGYQNGNVIIAKIEKKMLHTSAEAGNFC